VQHGTHEAGRTGGATTAPGEAAPLPVFVDPTGGRHRRARRVAVAVSVLCAAFVGTAALGLTGTGPLSGSPILTPVVRALDGLGVPHRDGSPATEVAVSAPSAQATEAAGRTSSGGGRGTAALSRTTGPSAAPTPQPSPTAGRPTPTPTPTPTAASARALPTTPGSDHRASPTPRSTSTPRGRPSPTPTG
jgi:hypothetical protein